MPHRGKLLLKRLSQSDLTFFEHHYRDASSKQKAINLNTDIFVEKLYPALPDFAASRQWRIPLDLWILGPGGRHSVNLQRKILKGTQYKNWRLNGELVMTAESSSQPFHLLQKGDLVLMSFEGDVVPESGNFLFLAKSDHADIAIHAALDTLLDSASMEAYDVEEIARALRNAGATTPDEHLLTGFLGESEFELAAAGDPAATEIVRHRRRRRTLTWSELSRTRQDIDQIGRQGEELVDVYFSQRLRSSLITEYEWISDADALAPYDFSVTEKGTKTLIDVKTTRGGFGQRVHISLNELKQMATIEHYHLYRVYALSEEGGSLRVIGDLQQYAESILEILRQLPEPTAVPGVFCDPNSAGTLVGQNLELTPPVADEDSDQVE